MNNKPALELVLDWLSCKCKSCNDKICTCCRNSLNCTSVCGCKSLCDNAIEVDATNVIQDSDDYSDFQWKLVGSQVQYVILLRKKCYNMFIFVSKFAIWVLILILVIYLSFKYKTTILKYDMANKIK